MPENKFNDSHPIIPVAHPNGDIHNIAVPPDTDLGDFHAALEDYYHGPGWMAKTSQPTAEGAVENSQAFRSASDKAWLKSGLGHKNVEDAFFIDNRGSATPITEEQQSGTGEAQMRLSRPAGSNILVHTHPNSADGNPSPQDKQTAKLNKMTVYVASREGLFAVDPAGAVTHVFRDPDWMSKKNSK